MTKAQLRLHRALGQLNFIKTVRDIENSEKKQLRENLYIRISVWLRWFGVIGVNIMSFLATDIDAYYFWLGMFIALSVGYLLSSIFTTRRSMAIWIRQTIKQDGATCPDAKEKYRLSSIETFNKIQLEIPYVVSNVFSVGLAIRNIIILG
jgi:magnesium-transporting ATPase (P-type)